MAVIPVELAGRSYNVLVGRDLLDQAASHAAAFIRKPRVAVVADRNARAHHGARLEAALAADGRSVAWYDVEPGEGSKSWQGLQALTEWLLEQGVERGDHVFALGGGVVGDLTGFACAILKRGCGFVQVPTTLLAQVDSSVGGKTGINAPQGKNLIGAFHQPSLVLADTAVLGTLTERDLLAGYGEVVKYGLLGDFEFFQWLEKNASRAAAGDMDARIHAVKRSVQMKAEIVERDETEQGDRALLNLGHTFCHAFEAATGYSDRLLHGEGVAIGCALAFEVSARMGWCSQEDPSRLRAHLRDMKMKVDLADIPGELPDADGLIALMGQDKKVVDGQIRFIMARGIGEAFVTQDVDIAIVRTVLQEALAAR